VLVVSLQINHEKHLVRALADTVSSSSILIILEGFTSKNLSKSDEITKAPGEPRVDWLDYFFTNQVTYVLNLFFKEL
jgi:hypothetical protein